MAITTMRRTAAHPAAFMGRAISITGSSWAWAHGRTGVMATVGESIASAVAEEEDTSPAVETAVDMFIEPITQAARRYTLPVIARYTLRAIAMAAPTPPQRMVAPLTAAD